MRILIRADGGGRVGIGHVMRLLALADWALAEDGVVVLASASLDEALGTRARRSGVAVVQSGVEPGTLADARWLIDEAAARHADWTVVDGYQFGGSYQDALRDAGIRVLFIDDFGHCEHYAADVVLNQNVSATSAMYGSRRDDTRLLLGPEYAILRPGFRSAAATAPAIPDRAVRILVTLGGADPENVTERILDALAVMTDSSLQVRVVVGPSNPHGKQLASRVVDPRIEILPAADDMVPLMTWADMAVTGAGITVYELCCLGIPTLVVALADYQRGLVHALDREGLCASLGSCEALDLAVLAETMTSMRDDRTRRAALSGRGRARVDGRGAKRVLDVLAASLDG